MESELDARDWMQWFVGASEEDLINFKDMFITSDGSKLRNKETREEWPMGSFDMPSVEQLKGEVHQMPRVRAGQTPCPFTILDEIDIGAYQATLKTEEKSMVQIASNFHCLENGNPSTPADCGYLVTGYATDSTQGPAASFGVPAASLLRAHYPFWECGKPPGEWGQSSERQVNLIRDISKWCGSCVNGKALLTGEEEEVEKELIDDVAGRVRIGLHSDAQVVFQRGSRRRQTLRVVDGPYPLVDQVCSATICYGYVDRKAGMPPKGLTNLARALLRAAYEGAYLAAIKRKRHLLLLTLIGGASFRNPMEVILEELKRAHEMWATHPASELKEVRLLLYEPGSADRFQQELDRIPNRTCVNRGCATV